MREQTAEVSAPIEQEFLSVIREYERVIYKVCYLYANPNAPLNDLYQDVVLNLWKAYPKFRKECKVSTWIYRIALNTCISFYRKEKNVPEIVSLTKGISSICVRWRKRVVTISQQRAGIHAKMIMI